MIATSSPRATLRRTPVRSPARRVAAEIGDIENRVGHIFHCCSSRRATAASGSDKIQPRARVPGTNRPGWSRKLRLLAVPGRSAPTRARTFNIATKSLVIGARGGTPAARGPASASPLASPSVRAASLSAGSPRGRPISPTPQVQRQAEQRCNKCRQPHGGRPVHSTKSCSRIGVPRITDVGGRAARAMAPP